MGRPNKKLRKQSQNPFLEPLVTVRGEDGLWQSIERDEEPADCWQEAHQNTGRACCRPEPRQAAELEVTTRTKPLERSPVSPCSSCTMAPSAGVPPPSLEREPSPSGVGGDHILLVRAGPDSPLSRPGAPAPVSQVSRDLQTTQAAGLQGPEQCLRVTKRPRGRPKKTQSRNVPNWNRPRRVRFSNPFPPDLTSDPGETRDTHVFVRLLKIAVSLEEAHPAALWQELVWNNRAKCWRLAGGRSDRDVVDIPELFDDLDEHGSLVRVVVAPTVGQGAREPVEMGWDAVRCCFQGGNEDMENLSITLGEMKDMVKDPWARQFVGYIMGR